MGRRFSLYDERVPIYSRWSKPTLPFGIVGAVTLEFSGSSSVRTSLVWMVIELSFGWSRCIFHTEYDYQVYKYALKHVLCLFVQAYRNIQQSCKGYGLRACKIRVFLCPYPRFYTRSVNAWVGRVCVCALTVSEFVSVCLYTNCVCLLMCKLMCLHLPEIKFYVCSTDGGKLVRSRGSDGWCWKRTSNVIRGIPPKSTNGSKGKPTSRSSCSSWQKGNRSRRTDATTFQAQTRTDTGDFTLAIAGCALSQCHDLTQWAPL